MTGAAVVLDALRGKLVDDKQAAKNAATTELPATGSPSPSVGSSKQSESSKTLEKDISVDTGKANKVILLISIICCALKQPFGGASRLLFLVHVVSTQSTRQVEVDMA